ncbi:MAG: alpha/beta hydrolase [Acidobacteriota bacterium]
MSSRIVRHGAVRLALHRLREGDERVRLLLLHEADGSAAELAVPPWEGEVWALDFTGHGDSSAPSGGGLSAEILLSDVDAALQEIGPSTLWGFGLGAYIALLTAAAAPESVRGVVLSAGRGLAGGGPEPQPLDRSPAVQLAALRGAELLRAEAVADVRPPGYAKLLVRQARELGAGRLSVDERLRGEAGEIPWLQAVIDSDGVRCEPASLALAEAARIGG